MQEVLMQNGMQNSQIRAIAMAFAGAVVAAVATMFVPIGILESVSGSTGLPELVPAARAPLGDTARALIAFGAGAVIFAVLAFVLLRADHSPTAHTTPVAQHWADEEAQPWQERASWLKLRSNAFSKMPWNKGDDDLTELSDLPKLRTSDVHPDAPPRRPLSAQVDLPVLDSVEIDAPLAQQTVGQASAEVENPFIERIEAAVPAIAAAVSPITAEDVKPTLSEMVAQLEAAVAERQKQLAELEAVATQLGGNLNMVKASSEPIEVARPPRAERPPLEAVPASVRDDDMDSALAAALATLHRMNGTGR